MSKLSELRVKVDTMDSLTESERDSLLAIINQGSPWYVTLLKIIKYLGAVAGYVLAGLGFASCAHMFNL